MLNDDLIAFFQPTPNRHDPNEWRDVCRVIRISLRTSTGFPFAPIYPKACMRAGKGPGPIRHAEFIINRSETVVRLFYQPTLAVRLTAPGGTDNKLWDGIEYFDPVQGEGVVFMFKPDNDTDTQSIRLRELSPHQTYRLTFEDGTNPKTDALGAQRIKDGIPVTLKGKFVSELMFIKALEE